MSEELSFEPGSRSNKVRKVFLDWIQKGYSPTKAAKKAGYSVRHFNRWRDEDADFRADWEDAYESGSDVLEDTAVSRAKRSSDNLLKTLLVARRPDKFRGERGDVNVKVSNVTANIDEELERKIARALGEDKGD